MKRSRKKPNIFVAALLLWGVIPGIAVASGEAEAQRSFVWIKSVGLSYPLVASLSGGVHAPIFGKFSFETVAVQANIDLGIGGGMASGGIYFPVGGDGRTTLSAFTVKAAVLRTWVLNIGGDRDRTYSGFVVERFQAAAGMGGKFGLGYFRSNSTMPSSNNDLVYLYVGLGI